MAVLSPWSPPWQTTSGNPASQATDAEVAAAVAAASVASAIAYTPSGLILASTANVQDALDALDEHLSQSIGEVWYDDKTSSQTIAVGAGGHDLVDLDSWTGSVPDGQIYEVRLEPSWTYTSAVGGYMTFHIADGSDVAQKVKISSMGYGTNTAVAISGPVTERIVGPATVTRKARCVATTAQGNINASTLAPVKFSVHRIK